MPKTQPIEEFHMSRSYHKNIKNERDQDVIFPSRKRISPIEMAFTCDKPQSTELKKKMTIIKEVKGFKHDVNKPLNDKNKLLGNA